MIKKCNHNPNTKDNTLIRVPILKMVFPQKYNYYCKMCHKTLEYIKDEKGFLILIEEDKDDNKR